MSFKAIVGNLIPKYIRLSKTEAKILDTIVATKSGNAYGLWKTSGLKHYPTVLRTLKKLEGKRLVQALSESGTRGERIYSPTLVGILVSYVFNREDKKIVEIVAKDSSLFRELSKIKKNDDLAFYAVQDILLDVYRKKEPQNIDDAIKKRLEDDIIDNILDYAFNRNEKAMELILKFSKIKWMRERTVIEVESERISLKQAMKSLDELTKELERLV